MTNENCDHTKEYVFKIMKNKVWLFKVIKFLQDEYGNTLFGISSREPELNTPRKWLNFGDAGQITAQLSLPFQCAIKRVLNDEYEILIRNRNKSTSDLEIYYDGQWNEFELKTTMGKSFQGSTHSYEKADNWIFIKYNIDMDTDLTQSTLPGLFTDIHAVVLSETDLNKNTWKGKPGKRNSRSGLQIRANSPFSRKWKKSLIMGEIKYCRKWCKLETEPLHKVVIYGVQ